MAKKVVTGTVVNGVEFFDADHPPPPEKDTAERGDDRRSRTARKDRAASEDEEPTEDKPEPKDVARTNPTPKKEAPARPLVERASTVPDLDANIFGYYWEPTAGAPPEWHVFAGDPALFRASLADALLNKRMTRLYFSASGIWVQVPLPPINSV